MKALFVSNLFPDADEPLRGQDNANLLHCLAAEGVEWRVLAPRPSLGGKGEARRCLPRDESLKPRYPACAYLPKMGAPWNALLMRRALRREMERLRKAFPFEIILCSWLYPDGVATAPLAARHGVPLVLIAQGTDVHRYLGMPIRRKLIVSAAASAESVVTRSADLGNRLVEAGVDERKVRAIYNGIDEKIFFPGDRAEARRRLGLPEKGSILLFAGNLLEVKNPVRLVRAFAKLKNEESPQTPASLVMIGGGNLREEIEELGEELGCGENLRLLGCKTSTEVADYMRAADLLCLPSRNEGVPNVILEAFGCGLPVVASRVGGIPEVLNRSYLGELVTGDSVDEFAAAMRKCLDGGEAGTRRIAKYAESFSWEKCAASYMEVLEKALRSRKT